MYNCLFGTNTEEGTYCDKPIGVESVEEAGREAHLTSRCQDMKVQVCDRTERGPMKTKPEDKDKGVTAESLSALQGGCFSLSESENRFLPKYKVSFNYTTG